MTDPTPIQGSRPAEMSFAVSSVLLQDALSGDVLPARWALDEPNQVAPFGNLLIDGKQEALFIDTKQQLTYLHRGGGTGWGYTTVLGKDGKAVRAAEVVTVISSVDLSVNAVTVDDDGVVSAFRLVAGSGTGPDHVWQQLPIIRRPHSDERPPPKVRQLSVAYDGTSPLITGLTKEHVARFFYPGARPAGPVMYADEGRVVDMAQPVTGTCTTMTTSGMTVAGYLPASRVILVGFQGQPQAFQIAESASGLVGVFRGQYAGAVGVIYFDGAGELTIAWSYLSSPLKPVVSRIPGLGFTKASLWVDGAGMMHVYGRDASHRLQALHQVGWSDDATPIWAGGRKVTVAADGTAEETRTPVAIGLHPKVVDFAVDPYPDYVSSQFVALDDAAGDSRFATCSQDVNSARWSTEVVRVEATSHEPNPIDHYLTTVVLLDGYGAPAAGKQITVGAETLAEITVDGASRLVGGGHSTVLTLDATGRASIAQPANTLIPPTLTVTAVGATSNALIQAASDVHNYLAGNAALPTQNGRFSAQSLMDAKGGDGQKIAPGLGKQAAEDLVGHIGDVFKVAHGQPVYDRRWTGGGPATALAGFSLHAGRDGHVEGRTHQDTGDVKKALLDIRSAPEYGGIIDDLLAVVGDVWEGIRNGAIEVAHALVDAGRAVLHLFVRIGTAVFELAETLIDGVNSAVHAVEAMFRTVVAAVNKVVEWLRALFDFKDIWNAKTAFESFVITMFGYGTSGIQYYGAQAEAWFDHKEDDVRDWCRQLRELLGPARAGDMDNHVPPMTDASGGVLDRRALQRNPQATWMLDRISSRAAAEPAALRLESPHRTAVGGALEEFIDSLGELGIGECFRPVLDALAKLTDPADPNAAGRIALSAVVDLFEAVAVGALDFGAAVVRAVTGLLVRIVESVLLAFQEKVNDPVVKALYHWVQTKSGIAPDMVEDPTEIGVACLIAGFFTTTVYKLVEGVDQHPFPGGKFPAVPVPPWYHDYDAQAPAITREECVQLQKYLGIMGLFGAIGEAAGDLNYAASAHFERNSLPLPGWLIAAGNVTAWAALIGSTAALVGTTPTASGLEWTTGDGVYLTIAFALAAPSTVFQAIGVVAGWKHSPHLKNVIIKGEWYGSWITALSNIPPLLMDVIAGVAVSATPYSIVAASLHNIAGLVAPFRPKAPSLLPPRPPQVMAREIAKFEAWCMVSALVTGAIETASASMTMIGAILELGLPPLVITSGASITLYRGEKATARIAHTGESHAYDGPLVWNVNDMKPWSWNGLTLDSDGRFQGTPAITGSQTLFVSFRNSYAPPMESTTAQIVLEVVNKPSD